MSAFGSYSRYYNLFYREKDYAGETAFIDGLIRKYRPAAQTILDLGCGTGRHALLLAAEGYAVTGVDRSREMLARAETQAHKRVSFQQGDIRKIRLDRTFDIAVSLFHVISYLPENRDLRDTFATVSAHLADGGLFIFDCWYGPAVLHDRPTVRVKRLADEESVVLRIVEPMMLPNDNLVDLHYQVLVEDKATGAWEEIKEIHRMRYLFRPELEMLLEDAGLVLVEAREWLSDKPLGWDTWGACFVARKEG